MNNFFSTIGNFYKNNESATKNSVDEQFECINVSKSEILRCFLIVLFVTSFKQDTIFIEETLYTKIFRIWMRTNKTDGRRSS